ncbi:MAG: endonuclease domain-containing protein [Candidatus Caenarcaniphilales bacterium]|nr:endonuclease domain-containing protein [Candidatus Caenarcaniphilales bacterium]
MKRFISFNPKLKDRARELRKNSTEAESKIWKDFLRSFPLPVYRQKPIDNFIVDFYVPKIKLVIEIDGETHFEDNAIEYDRQRTAILEGYGLKVLRFTNKEVYENFESFCEVIMECVIPPHPPLEAKEQRGRRPLC